MSPSVSARVECCHLQKYSTHFSFLQIYKTSIETIKTSFSPLLSLCGIVLPAVLGLAAAAFIVLMAFYCTRRLRLRNKKTHNESSVPFQPPRRPTAVRSPSGQPPHYLKKSPSPTATKPLPGTMMNTAESKMISSQTSCGTLSPPHGKMQTMAIAPSKYTEENEIQTKTIVNMTSSEHTNGQNLVECAIPATDLTDYQEYGKLGSLVFKLRYLVDRNALVVSVVRCRGLPNKISIGEMPTGMNGKTQTATDPYVKLQLLPDKQHKVKTRCILYFEISLIRFLIPCILFNIINSTEWYATHEIPFTTRTLHSTVYQ